MSMAVQSLLIRVLVPIRGGRLLDEASRAVIGPRPLVPPGVRRRSWDSGVEHGPEDPFLEL